MKYEDMGKAYEALTSRYPTDEAMRLDSAIGRMIIRLGEALEAAEWGGESLLVWSNPSHPYVPHHNEYAASCPCCHWPRPHGHQPGCALGDAVALYREFQWGDRP